MFQTTKIMSYWQILIFNVLSYLKIITEEYKKQE